MSQPATSTTPSRRLSAPSVRLGLIGLLLVLLAVFPASFASNQLLARFVVLTLIYISATVSWNFFSGFSGYISLGHAVFFGVGAYTVGLLAKRWSLPGGDIFALLPLGGLLAGAVAVPFGLIALRVRRHTFVVITIAVFFIFQLMAYNFSFTGGVDGVSMPFFLWSQASFDNPFYYVALILAVGVTLFSWLMRRSRFGLQLLAIRDDEDRARGLGVRAMRVKLTAFVLSGVFTGVIGGLWIFFIGQALPEYAFNPVFDLTVALMAFLGGFGTLAGPVLGAAILEPLQSWVLLQFPDGFIGEIFLGVLFLAVILLLPRGIIPTSREKAMALSAWWDRRRRPGPDTGQLAAAAAGQPAGAPTVPTEAGSPGTGGRR